MHKEHFEPTPLPTILSHRTTQNIFDDVIWDRIQVMASEDFINFLQHFNRIGLSTIPPLWDAVTDTATSCSSNRLLTNMLMSLLEEFYPLLLPHLISLKNEIGIEICSNDLTNCLGVREIWYHFLGILLKLTIIHLPHCLDEFQTTAYCLNQFFVGKVQSSDQIKGDRFNQIMRPISKILSKRLFGGVFLSNKVLSDNTRS